MGGVNCAAYYNGDCQSYLANEEDWRRYYNSYDTIACPPELPFGTKILLDNNEFTCRDRGGAITITPEGYYWIDILSPSVPYYYGEVKEAIIIEDE